MKKHSALRLVETHGLDRPACAGNGETCRRAGNEGMAMLPCPGPDACGFAQGSCKAYARLHVVVGDEDALGSFVLRTTSYNTIRTLAARLHYFQAVSGGLLACLPLELKLRGKSTTMSQRAPIYYYVDLVVRAGMTLEKAIVEARRLDGQRRASGFDQAALDEAARQGFADGAFEELAEDGPTVVEEFFMEEGPAEPHDGSQRRGSDRRGKETPVTVDLRERLDAQITRGA